jgi:hypothetical protein
MIRGPGALDMASENDARLTTRDMERCHKSAGALPTRRPFVLGTCAVARP